MFEKLEVLDQLYAQSILDKCVDCSGIEECKQDMIGLIPDVIQDSLTNKYHLAVKKCKYGRGETNNITIKNYNDWSHKQKASIIKHIQKNRNIYLYGDVGIGKTYFLKWLANQVNKKGKDVYIANVADIMRKTKEQFNRKLELGESSYLDRLQNVDYLFLDDCGNERKTEYNIIEVLWAIIDYRYSNDKSTFITSNYTLIELYKIYGNAIQGEYGQRQVKPLVSRLKTFGEIEITGRNWRL